MLLEQLSNALEEMQNSEEFNLEDIKNIGGFLQKFKGEYIYPRIFKRKFDIDMKTSYEILNVLVEKKIIKLAFEIYCDCNKFQNDVYDSLNDIPNNLACEYCGKDIDIKKDLIVIYKVL
ncbi:MAG: hypothetical protein ACRC6T_09830 [Sarcina sp.]